MSQFDDNVCSLVDEMTQIYVEETTQPHTTHTQQ